MLRMRSSCRLTTVARPYLFRDAIASRGRAVADRAVNVETLLARAPSDPRVTSIGMPVPQFVAHLPGVVIISAFAKSETGGCIAGHSPRGVGDRLRRSASAFRSRSEPCPRSGARRPR